MKFLRNEEKSKANRIKLGALIAAAFFALAAVCGGVYLMIILSAANIESLEGMTEPSGDYLDADEDILNEIREISGVSGLNDLLKAWAANGGGLMKKKSVINVLLVGIDNDPGRGSSANTDVLMLASVNKDTKTITLVSFLRDTYTYINSSKGDKFTKINAAYASGGMKVLVETLQNDYKIAIDKYASVDFKSFEGAIDIVGGVNVGVEKREADFINKNYGLNIKAGDNALLNGKEALQFCRIRKLDADGDISRTRRQRMVISDLIVKTKNAPISKLDDIALEVLKYVVTDMTKREMVSYGTQAITGQWFNYQIKELQMPTEETCMPYSGNSWVWIADIPKAAQILQTELYGTTNIKLAENRKTAMDLVRGK
ncbi:MAG: LCP family protein [Oscillospiraceae bacterium]|nr:LCP family protein [Oscillospiraceae bacterium]